MVGVGSKLHLDNVSSMLENTRNDIRPNLPAKVEAAFPGGDWQGFPWENSDPEIPTTVFLTGQ